jgi:hypothetical protein
MLAFRSVVWLGFLMLSLWLKVELSTGEFRACGLYKEYKEEYPRKILL